VAASGMGRARERVKLSKMKRGVCAGHWRGSKKGAGRVGGHHGREIRRRARVRTRRSMATVRKTELTRQAHDVERERGRAGATARHWRTGPAKQRERECAGEENCADRLAPLGSEQEREGAREGELPLTGGVRLSGGVGARARGQAGPSGPTGLFSPFLFLWIFLIPFLFLFSIGFFKSKFKLGFKFKLVQHFKEYFKLSMMQHVMTHKVLTKIDN
jgi:hypothetical protein